MITSISKRLVACVVAVSFAAPALAQQPSTPTNQFPLFTAMRDGGDGAEPQKTQLCFLAALAIFNVRIREGDTARAETQKAHVASKQFEAHLQAIALISEVFETQKKAAHREAGVLLMVDKERQSQLAELSAAHLVTCELEDQHG